MDRETLRQWLRRQPFEPFRVHVDDGRVFDVRFPRMNLLAQTFIKIGIPIPGSKSEIVCDYTEYVPLANITRLEPLAAPAQTSEPEKA